MRLFSRLTGEYLAEDASEAEREARAKQVKLARLQVARKHPKWIEVEEVDLVARGYDWLVSATTDRIYKRHFGVVFVDVATVVADMVELHWYVNASDGSVVFLERVTNPETWTQYLERRAALEQRRAAPKARPTWAEQ